MSQQKMTLADFDLQEVTIGKDGKGLKAVWFDTDDGNKEHRVNDVINVVHPDFIMTLKKFQEPLAMCLLLVKGWDYAREHTKKDLDVLQGAVKGYQEVIDRLKVTGIKFTGKEKYEGLKIVGSLKTPLGNTVVKSPAIVFQADVLGCEKVVEELAEQIRVETFQYIFKGRKAEPTLEDQIAEAEADQPKPKATKKKPGKQLEIVEGNGNGEAI